MFNLLGGLTAPPIHMYFDLLCGLVQALVFTLLTMVYWSLEKGDAPQQKVKKITNPNLQNVNVKANVK